jgi:hypothetical protein
MSGKLHKLASVASGVYGKLNTAQQIYNSNLKTGAGRVNTMTGELKGMVASYIGVSALIMGGRNALMAFDAQAKADAQLKSALISTNFAAGKSFTELANKAAEFQKKTLFGDEQVEEAQAMLLTFKNIRGDIYDRTIPAILDMATGMNTDAVSAALQLGKALNEPLMGLQALTRSGVQFSQGQKDLIKNLVETGKLAEAQAIILKEVNSQFGGRAEAVANASPWKLFMNQMDKYIEAFGGKIMQVLTKLISLAQWVERNIGWIKVLAAVTLTFAVVYKGWLILQRAHLMVLAAWKAALFIQIGLTKGWAIAQAQLNMTMLASPIGLIIAGAAALGVALYAIINKLNKARSVYDEVTNRARENTIREKMDLDLLFDALKRTNPLTDERKRLIKQLNEQYPGLLEGMNLEKAGLDELKLAYDKVAASIDQKAKMAAAQDMLEGVYKEQFKLLNEGPGFWKTVWIGLKGQFTGYGQAIGGAIGNKLSDLADKESKLKEMLGGTSSFMGGFNPPGGGGKGLGGDNVIDDITKGGTRPTTINITLGKFQDQIVIHAQNVKEGAAQIRDIIMEEMARVLNSANYALKQ